MKKPLRSAGFTAGLVVTLSCILMPRGVRAQGAPIDVQMFRPAMDSKGILSVESTQVLSPGMFSIGLTVSYANNPLKLKGDLRGGPDRTFKVQHLTSAWLQFAIGLFKIKRMPFMEIGIGVPVHVLTGSANPMEEALWDQDPAVTATGVQPPMAYEDNGNFAGQGVGDLYLNLKMRFLAATKAPVGLGTVISVAFPLSKVAGGHERFMGSGGYTIWPRFVLDAFLDKKKRWYLSFNVGARLRFGTEAELKPNPGWGYPGALCTPPNCSFDGKVDNALTTNLIWQHDATVGLGISYAIVKRKVDWITEVYGAVELTSFGKDDDYWKRTYPAEFLTGLKVYLATNSYLAIAGGIGITGIGPMDAAGAPDFRAVASFVFEPLIGDRDGDGLRDDVDKCPDDPEDLDDFEDDDGCPEPDNDKDGIPDKQDKCPNEPAPGTKDGCPVKEIMDRDGDKIPDNVDKCPDDPEDFDNFEDTDGCPDKDNDQDGIPDKDDNCSGSDADKENKFARTKEDMDGHKDEDGCPDPDNDKDRICDKNDQIQKTRSYWTDKCKGYDKCPNEPETYNGFQDEDGCPDKGKVVIEKEKLVIMEKIYFETNKAIIKPVSYNILNAVAASLKGNPNIKLVEIQGHCDERGSDSYNLRLSDDRANAVRRFLINKGTASSRLLAKGYGETKPKCRRSNESCWSKNRRVEFIIKVREEADDD